MSAEYTLHIRTEEMTDEVMEGFFYNHIGSKWCPITKFLCQFSQEEMDAVNNGTASPELKARFEREFNKAQETMLEIQRKDMSWDVFYNSPQYDVGEVSFLKAALYEEGEEEFIPGLVSLVGEVVGDGVVITPDLVAYLEANIATVENTTRYKLHPEGLIAFLKENIGKEVFSIAW